MQIDVLDTLNSLYQSSGIAQYFTNPLALVMVGIACLLLYLAIVKQFEPLLLLPIAFGMLLTNLLGSDIFHEELFSGGHVNWGLFGGAVLADGGSLLDQAAYVVNAAGQVINSATSQVIGHFTSAVQVEATVLAPLADVLAQLAANGNSANVVMEGGSPLEYIRRDIGHKSDHMLRNIYGHMMLESKERFAQQRNDYYASLKVKPAEKSEEQIKSDQE